MMIKINKNGFSVIEMAIVLLIVGIVAIIAVSVYKPYALKSHRTDGMNAIATIQLAEETYRSNNSSYGTLGQLGLSSTSPQSYYTLAVSNVSATAYTITATGSGTQANDAEGATACSPLTLTVSNSTVTEAPTACWPS